MKLQWQVKLHPRWIARAFFTTVDLVNQLEAEGRAGRQGRIADYLTRLDVVILDNVIHKISA